MKTTGKITDDYLAVARHSGRLAPRDTDLYGRFVSVGDAEEEAAIRGGRVVRVRETVERELWTEPKEGS